eukprot:gene16792-60155_t
MGASLPTMSEDPESGEPLQGTCMKRAGWHNEQPQGIFPLCCLPISVRPPHECDIILAYLRDHGVRRGQDGDALPIAFRLTGPSRLSAPLHHALQPSPHPSSHPSPSSLHPLDRGDRPAPAPPLASASGGGGEGGEPAPHAGAEPHARPPPGAAQPAPSRRRIDPTQPAAATAAAPPTSPESPESSQVPPPPRAAVSECASSAITA